MARLRGKVCVCVGGGNRLGGGGGAISVEGLVFHCWWLPRQSIDSGVQKFNAAELFFVQQFVFEAYRMQHYLILLLKLLSC